MKAEEDEKRILTHSGRFVLFLIVSLGLPPGQKIKVAEVYSPGNENAPKVFHQFMCL